MGADSLAPGDVFIGNDAYEGGGTHLPDIVLAEPIFQDGKLIAWAINTAHHSDFADRGHAHIYQEGLRIPRFASIERAFFRKTSRSCFS